MSISNKDYLNKLIAKAKKSWEGVDVDSYMSGLRDNDMKTIEERAKANLAYEQDFCGHSLSENMVCRAYVRGAEEQKAIDEEVRLKKCDDITEAEYNRETAFADWYHKNGKGTPTYSDAIEWARKEVISKVCEWLKARNVLTEVSIEGFKKAMEESVWK